MPKPNDSRRSSANGFAVRMERMGTGSSIFYPAPRFPVFGGEMQIVVPYWVWYNSPSRHRQIGKRSYDEKL